MNVQLFEGERVRLLRFAFTELNLRRVSLTVYEYNPRAIRSYEKAGFVVEGRVRQCLNRDGRRWDMLCMGILKEAWEQQNFKSQNLKAENELCLSRV